MITTTKYTKMQVWCTNHDVGLTMELLKGFVETIELKEFTNGTKKTIPILGRQSIGGFYGVLFRLRRHDWLRWSGREQKLTRYEGSGEGGFQCALSLLLAMAHTAVAALPPLLQYSWETGGEGFTQNPRRILVVRVLESSFLCPLIEDGLEGPFHPP